MKKVLTIFISIAIVLFISCVEPPENNDPIDETKYGYITPTAANLGTRVQIFNMDSTDYPLDEYQMLFTGCSKFILPDSIVNGIMFTTVPFKAISGEVKVLHVEYDSTADVEGFVYPLKNCDTVFIKPVFQVDEYSSLKDKRLTWSDLNYQISEKNSKFREEEPNAPIVWHGEVNGDTTYLSTSYRLNGVDYEHYISFYTIRAYEYLPELMNVYSIRKYLKNGVLRSDYNFFSQGVVKLQDWNPGTLISGRVITDVGLMNNFHFWCDFSE